MTKRPLVSFMCLALTYLAANAKAAEIDFGNPARPSTKPITEDVIPVDYRVVTVKDSSFGLVRTRITVEIEAPEAGTDRERLIAMMAAAMEQAAVSHQLRHRKGPPDAVSVRLWDTFGVDGGARNRIVYAADGCGWTGDRPCSQPIWTELLRGSVPQELVSRFR